MRAIGYLEHHSYKGPEGDGVSVLLAATALNSKESADKLFFKKTIAAF